MKRDILLTPQTVKILTPKKYLSLTAQERASFSSLSFEAPQIGGSGFGRFVAKLKYPIYTAEVVSGSK